MLTRLALVVATLAALLLVNTGRAADATERNKALIAVLQSEASLFEKARACQQLGETGTSEAVPVLARLLTDPKLSAYARSGLEGIPDQSAAAALRNAAQTMKGHLLAGVVNSLSALRDTQAVEILARLAADPGSGVTKEALLALGNISTAESIPPLEQALTSGLDSTRAEAAAACLLAAERQRTSGDLNKASALYDLIRKANVPTACRVGATRGAILARTADRVPFLIEQLRSEELPIRNAALLTVREVPDDALANALNVEVARATPDLQGQLLLALADCHNEKSIAAVQALGSSPNPEIRKTALTVLGQMGPGAVPALLLALQEDRVPEKSVVLSGLRAMEGSTVDHQLVQALASARAPGLRVDLIRLLDSRGVAQATPEILEQAAAPEKNVAIAALSALRSLAGPKELPALIAFTRSCTDESVGEAAENALAGVCSRIGDTACEAILNELKQATKPAERNSWTRVLGQVGYANALPAIEAAASDPDGEVAENALAQLGHWPTPAPMDTLLNALDSAGSPRLRKCAMTSVLELAATAADGAQVPEPKMVAWLTRANSAAQSTEEKRKLLGLLGRLKTVESFRLLAPYLEDPDLRTEAASAVVQISPALAKGEEASELKTALERIASTVPNEDLRRRALQVSKTIPAAKARVSLFDGRSLAGWEGSTKVWRVREGAIVGGSLDGNPQNEFLATARSYSNFVLRLEYRLVGTEGFVNSGVQFRSVRVTNPPNEMKGYQADIGAGYSGCLYDESRRNTFLAQPAGETIKRLERVGDWNAYEIRCEGKRIQLSLNGEKTVDYTEADNGIAPDGLIGLQIHGGNKAEVAFRNISIQEF